MDVHQNARLTPRCRELLVARYWQDAVGQRSPGSSGVGEDRAEVGGPVPA